MRIYVGQNTRPVIPIGWVGENNVTEIEFDFSLWVRLYGSGSATLKVKRQSDTNPYPVVLTMSGNIGTWLITDTDLAEEGIIDIQIVYVVDDKVKKSAVYRGIVAVGVEGSDTVPDPYDDWLDALAVISAQVAQAKTDAEGSAQDASGYATNAQQSANSAGQSANSASTSAGLAQGYANSASGSADSAEYYAGLAQQGAESSGYALFEVDTETGQAMVTVADNLDSELTFMVNENTGTLGVIVN